MSKNVNAAGDQSQVCTTMTSEVAYGVTPTVQRSILQESTSARGLKNYTDQVKSQKAGFAETKAKLTMS